MTEFFPRAETTFGWVGSIAIFPNAPRERAARPTGESKFV
jgi:hypothetical protein